MEPEATFRSTVGRRSPARSVAFVLTLSTGKAFLSDRLDQRPLLRERHCPDQQLGARDEQLRGGHIRGSESIGKSARRRQLRFLLRRAIVAPSMAIQFSGTEVSGTRQNCTQIIGDTDDVSPATAASRAIMAATVPQRSAAPAKRCRRMKSQLNSLRRFRREQRALPRSNRDRHTNSVFERPLRRRSRSVRLAEDLGRLRRHAGAEYAVAHGFDATEVAAAATSAARSAASRSTRPRARFYGLASATGNRQASTQGRSVPSDTSTGGTAGQYVSVTATMPFSAMFGAAGISYPSTLTATAVVRVQ